MPNTEIDWSIAKEEIRSRLDIIEVIGRYVTLKGAGQNMKGVCPFHKEKTPSLMVSQAKGIWHCFGCGKGGDVFTFVMEYEQLGFGEVIRKFAEETGVKLKHSPGASSGAPRSEISRAKLLKIHDIAVRYYYRQIKPNHNAVEFFKSRGLSSHIVREFQLGYAPPGWENFLSHAQSHGVPSAALVAAGLAIGKPDGSAYDRFRDRIMFPICDVSGRAIAFGGRGMGPDAEPKYLNSPETVLYRKNRTLYGLHKARGPIKDKNYVILVEGYMDFLSLYQAGICNVVATSGTALTEEHGRMIRRFSPRAVLLFDGDAAGVGAAQRAVFTLAPLGLDVRVLLLPESEDPDTYVRKYGTGPMLELIENAQPGIDFVIAQAIAANDADTAQGKSAIVSSLVGLIAATTDAIIAAEYIRKVSESVNVREQLIYNEVRKARRGSRGAQTREQKPLTAAESQRFISSLEGSVLALLVQHPQLIELAMERISPKTFTDSLSMNLYSLITDTYHNDPSLETLVGRLEEGEVKRIISRILVQPWPVDNPEEELQHALVRLERKSLKGRMRGISARLKDEQDDSVKTMLLQEQNGIAQRLRELETRW